MAQLRVDPGKLRHKTTIYEVVETEADDGTVTATDSEIAERWAWIRPLRGREYLEAGALDSTVTHRIVIRYCADVSPKCKLVNGSRTYEIVAVLNADERDEWQELMCVERVG